MTIAKANILTSVNNSLRESLTDIDNEIIACLNDLSNFNLLIGTDPHETTALDASFYLPADFKEEISVVPSLSGTDYERLLPYPGGYKEYKDAMANYNSGLASQPTHYVVLNKAMYLYRPVASAYTITTTYYKFHAQTADDIEFGDEFINCINFGVTYFTALFRKKTSYINIWRPIYIEERAAKIALMPEQPRIVRG